MSGSHNYQAAKQVLVTTTGNIDNLDIDGVGLIVMNNASLATLRGVQANSNYHGKILGIISIGAGQVDIAHQDTNSTAANRFVIDVARTLSLVAGQGAAFFKYDGQSARWRMMSHGHAGNIHFPAAQNASSHANTLDDYEEGTWTPTITGSGGGSGQVYTAQDGYYRKVGSLVHVSFRVALSTLGTVTTSAQIGGLPFTTANLTQLRAIATLNWANMTTALYVVEGQIVPNVTTINILGNAAAVVSIGSLVQADFSNTSVIAGSVEYIAAN